MCYETQGSYIIHNNGYSKFLGKINKRKINCRYNIRSVLVDSLYKKEKSLMMVVYRKEIIKQFDYPCCSQ